MKKRKGPILLRNIEKYWEKLSAKGYQFPSARGPGGRRLPGAFEAALDAGKELPRGYERKKENNVCPPDLLG